MGPSEGSHPQLCAAHHIHAKATRASMSSQVYSPQDLSEGARFVDRSPWAPEHDCGVVPIMKCSTSPSLTKATVRIVRTLRGACRASCVNCRLRMVAGGGGGE